MTKEIKAILKKNKIPNKTNTKRGFVWIKTDCEVSEEIRKEIRSLETYESHGDAMIDTQYSTGLMILLNGCRI